MSRRLRRREASFEGASDARGGKSKKFEESEGFEIKREKSRKNQESHRFKKIYKSRKSRQIQGIARILEENLMLNRVLFIIITNSSRDPPSPF